MNLEDLEKFNFTLPEELIRKKGVEPRDSARLFVYDTKSNTITHSTFRDLATFLPEKSLLVLNDTRVIPARLWLTKETGGKIEVFVLMNELESTERIPVLVDRKTIPGAKLYFNEDKSLYFEVKEQVENRFFVQLMGTEETLQDILLQYGQTPLPHYLEGEATPESTLRERYQTIFAKNVAENFSVAAPTASLHFTDAVFKGLADKSIEKATLTLDVGLGTFAPLKDEHFAKNTLHQEKVSIGQGALSNLQDAKKNKRPIIAIGTTVTRSLESLAMKDITEPSSFTTDIFITPGYHFQNSDILITNFHLPKSSLMLLVEAFLQDKKAKRGVVDLYHEAIKEGYSFYSFGDSMLIL